MEKEIVGWGRVCRVNYEINEVELGVVREIER